MTRKTIIIINAIIVLTCLWVYFFFLNPIIKAEPTVGHTYFDIPLLLSKKNIDEIIKVKELEMTIYGNGNPNETRLHADNNGWIMDIIFDNITREIRLIKLSQFLNYYQALDFNNDNIDTFLKVGNLDKRSNSYDLFILENSVFDPLSIGKPIGEKFTKATSIIVYPKAPSIIYDIPNLIGKNIHTISEKLGNDFVVTDLIETDDENFKKWSGIIKKEGYTLYVTIRPKNREITLFQIVADEGGFENAKDMLTVGNLDSTSKSYSIVLGQSSSIGNKYNSVTIYPKK